MARGDYDLRRGEPGQAIDYTDADGNQRRVKANSEGVFTPKDQNEVTILDGFDLPVARVTKKGDRKASRNAEPSEPRGSDRPTRVAVEETGQEDTRGPGAPAVEPGVRDVEEK